jgi:uncharacterized SAM-binding protein YcdF (DUF218 family)
MPTRASPPRPRRLIVVLGGTNSPSGRLASMSVRRLRGALALFRTAPDPGMIAFGLTGGHGAHFNTSPQPHWWYCRRWLLRHGVPAQQIRFATASSRTPEDAQLTGYALRNFTPGKIELVTSDFHARRTRMAFAHFLPGWRLRLHRTPCLRTFPPGRQQELRAHETRRMRSYLSEGIPALPRARLRRGVVTLAGQC